MKLVDFGKSDLKSKIYYKKLARHWMTEADSCIFQAEKDTQISQTLIAQCAAMKRKTGVMKEDKEVRGKLKHGRKT